MLPDDIANLTLRDLEAIAERFSGAVRTIREAQALLGGGASAPAPAAYVPGPSGSFGGAPGTLTINGGMPVFTHEPTSAVALEARAKREQFLRELRQSPERQEAVAALRGEPAADDEPLEEA